MTVVVDNRSGEELFEDAYAALAAFVMAEESVAEDTELSLSLVDLDEMQALNRAYRGIDAPTDVLSFENDGELLGDIIICPAVARRHAEDFDSDFASEMELMVVHGILHLTGHDHVDDAQGDVMEAREDELLKAWKHHKTGDCPLSYVLEQR
jgi:probable rRNA maturation factor